MNKVIVIGSPGAGKSYFSKQLASSIELPLYHLDNIYWKEDRTHISRDELILKMNEIMGGDKWIIDGNYISTIEHRISRAETIFFLDFPTKVCMEGIASRVGVKRDDMPWTEDELDPEFRKFVEEFQAETQPLIDEILSRYPDKELYRFTSREDIRRFMEDL